jgi:hypothetical protein
VRFYEWAGKESDIKQRLAEGANFADESEFRENNVVVKTKQSESWMMRIRFTGKWNTAAAERRAN